MSDRALHAIENAIKCLTETIKGLFGGHVSDDDKKLLEGLLKRAERITKKLQRLDDLTPNKPKKE
jgi:hypothetical protein